MESPSQVERIVKEIQQYSRFVERERVEHFLEKAELETRIAELCAQLEFRDKQLHDVISRVSVMENALRKERLLTRSLMSSTNIHTSESGVEDGQVNQETLFANLESPSFRTSCDAAASPEVHAIQPPMEPLEDSLSLTSPSSQTSSRSCRLLIKKYLEELSLSQFTRFVNNSQPSEIPLSQTDECSEPSNLTLAVELETQNDSKPQLHQHQQQPEQDQKQEPVLDQELQTDDAPVAPPVISHERDLTEESEEALQVDENLKDGNVVTQRTVSDCDCHPSSEICSSDADSIDSEVFRKLNETSDIITMTEISLSPSGAYP